jgi:hypothetical protein
MFVLAVYAPGGDMWIYGGENGRSFFTEAAAAKAAERVNELDSDFEAKVERVGNVDDLVEYVNDSA